MKPKDHAYKRKSILNLASVKSSVKSKPKNDWVKTLLCLRLCQLVSWLCNCLRVY